jgi:phosphatidate cytidylyltransferase
LSGEANAKSSDLKVRIISAIVMVTIAGFAFFVGGLVFSAFVSGIALWALWEWWGLTAKIAESGWARVVWLAVGIGYIGAAAFIMNVMRNDLDAKMFALGLVGIVIATDVGAYFTGRTLGGKKIAPSISPSKTWSGLFGGMIAAGLLAVVMAAQFPSPMSVSEFGLTAAFGALLAIVAQTGDFFESWMKRRAGVKDSGSLIPGHGGVLDRIDGLIPVIIVSTGLLLAMVFWSGGI